MRASETKRERKTVCMKESLSLIYECNVCESVVCVRVCVDNEQLGTGLRLYPYPACVCVYVCKSACACVFACVCVCVYV